MSFLFQCYPKEACEFVHGNGARVVKVKSSD